MKPEYPHAGLIAGLRQLWKQAFGDTDAFLDLFFSTGYRPDHCRCITEAGQPVAALYWLDFYCEEQKFAYIYAVATDPACRGQGLCRQLMADTADLLTAKGYHGAILIPQDEGLRIMYGKMGYLPATAIDEYHCAGGTPCPVREITAGEYLQLRSALLPAGSLTPADAATDLLAALARFYAGDGFVAAAGGDEAHLRFVEYLGPQEKQAALVAALGHTEATIRTVGNGTDFAMYLPLVSGCIKPEYYPFAFD